GIPVLEAGDRAGEGAEGLAIDLGLVVRRYHQWGLAYAEQAGVEGDPVVAQQAVGVMERGRDGIGAAADRGRGRAAGAAVTGRDGIAILEADDTAGEGAEGLAIDLALVVRRHRQRRLRHT